MTTNTVDYGFSIKKINPTVLLISIRFLNNIQGRLNNMPTAFYSPDTLFSCQFEGCWTNHVLWKLPTQEGTF